MVGLGAGHLTRSHFSEALKSSRPGQESSEAPHTEVVYFVLGCITFQPRSKDLIEVDWISSHKVSIVFGV